VGKEVLDLRELADWLIDRAKELLSSEGHFEPVGFVLMMTGKLICLGLDMSNKEAGKNSQRELWALAQKKKAVAVFTVVDCMFRQFEKDEQPEVDVLKAGLKSIDWDADPKVKACIEMEIMVPGEYPTTVLVPYCRDENGRLEFETPMESAEDRDVNRFTFWGRECALQN
jgi:hypothetical protein